MASEFNYDFFVTRNAGYVSPETQQKLRGKTLLIAGCGIGSSVAICAARFGFERFILVDGDIVDAHNLNRQFYAFSDVGRPKVLALRDQILTINPEAKVEAIQAYLDRENTAEIVGRSDIVFDTVDFLDLGAILALHVAAQQYQVPIMTALSIGFGAGVLYFPAGAERSLVDLIEQDVKDAGGGADGAAYAQVFAGIVARIGRHLDAQVVEQIAKALTIMEDGKPCPASQVAVGSFTIAAMAVSMMHDILEGRQVPVAPRMVVHSFRNHETKLIDISSDN